MQLEEKDEKRRKWATSEIAGLKAQRDNLDRRITELEGFLSILAQSDAAISGRVSVKRYAPLVGDSLGVLIAKVLSRSNGSGLTVSEITDEVMRFGFKAPTRAKAMIRVGSELYRHAKKGRRGVVQIGTGRFSIQSR